MAIAFLAPLLGTADPAAIDPISRNLRPFAERVSLDADVAPAIAWMGTDSLGRDVYSRVVYGARVSLLVGAAVAVTATAVGLFLGLLAGWIGWLDALLMRVMDGLMAIPGILLALALLSLWGSGVLTVIVAITLPEVPRVVRLVRSIVLQTREEPFVEAAVGLGTPTPLILWRHILPSTTAPLLVQATYAAASAVLVEAILSFLGIGIPPEVPSWGNIMAEGRTLFRVYPHTIFFPGICLALTILAVNALGDGLRDAVDPGLRRDG